nr:ATP-binding protein [Nostoc parmelioides]
MILQQRLADIEIIKEYGDLPKITCDASQINQVFLHLLTNSIDALLERKNNSKSYHGQEISFSPTIWISTIVDDVQQVVIRVTDNGIGIDSDIISKIFDPFFTTKPVGKGTGLGLSISYQIVEKHQGNLECLSSLTDGTTFIVKLPISLK